MKKQIFILLLALFAVNTAFGQSPRLLTCTIAEGALNPALGKTYVYSVSIPNTADFTGIPGLTYQWFVTKSKTFITAGAITTSRALAAEYNAAVAAGTFDNVSNTVNAVSISWKTITTSTDPYFVVVNVIGSNGICSPKNMKVYKIIPQNLFTLDITNMDVTTIPATPSPIAYETPFYQCMSDIQSMTWDNSQPNNAIYDYGTNTLIWAVVAANWSTNWTPKLQISGVNASEAITVGWSTTAIGGTVNSFIKNTISGVWETTVPVTPSSGTTVGATGEVIYIRMVLDHTTTPANFFEGFVDQTINLAIDGLTNNNDPDVHYSSLLPIVNTDCGRLDGFTYDKTIQVVKARPGINTTTPTTPEPFLTPVGL